MPNIFIESFEEVCKRWNVPYVILPTHKRVPFERGQYSDDKYLFENGSLSDGQRTHQDPPKEPDKLAGLIHLYWVTKGDQKRQEYSTLLQSCSTQNEFYLRGCGPTVSERYPQWEDHLENLSKEIKTIQDKVNALAETLPSRKRDEHIEKQQQLRQSKFEQSREEIRSRSNL